MLKTLAIASTLTGCSLPNTIGLGYGQSFEKTPGLPFAEHDDVSQALGVQATWQIKPTQVEMVSAPPPIPVPTEEPTVEEITEVLDTFILLHPGVQLSLVLAGVILIILFRSQLGRLLARVIGRNGNGAPNGKTPPK